MREADQPSDRGEVDDRAAAALAHPAGRRLAAVERAAEVDRDHVLPFLGRHRVDVADLAHAGAVDEDVDPPDRVRDALASPRSTAAGARTSTVGEQRLPRTRGDELLDDRLTRLLRPVENGDPGSLGGEDAARSLDRCRCRHPSPQLSCPSGARRPPVSASPVMFASSIAHVETPERETATWAITGARHGGHHRLRPGPLARLLLRPPRARARSGAASSRPP